MKKFVSFVVNLGTLVGVSGHSHSGNLDSADLGLQGVRSQTPAWAPRFYPEPVPSMSRINTSGFDGGSGYALSAEIHGTSDPSVAEALLKSARRELQMMTVARDAAVAGWLCYLLAVMALIFIPRCRCRCRSGSDCRSKSSAGDFCD